MPKQNVSYTARVRFRHRSDGRWNYAMDGYQKDGSPRFKTFYGKTQKEVKSQTERDQTRRQSGVQLTRSCTSRIGRYMVGGSQG